MSLSRSPIWMQRAGPPKSAVDWRRFSSQRMLSLSSIGTRVGLIFFLRETGEYNRPFLTPQLELISGYRRLQGIVYRKGDPRFEGRSLEQAIDTAISARDCLMVNRNAGSGTRILTDRYLAGAKPAGYWSQPKSHNAVGVAVAQGRADWGITIETIARQYGLGFIPAQDEHYDFIMPKARLARPALQRFLAVLEDPATRDALTALGFKV